jgi:hypothetical protein
MGTTWKRGKKNQGVKSRARKERALERLQKQLKEGFKMAPRPVESFLPLTDKDKTRIAKEIGVLETRL